MKINSEEQHANHPHELEISLSLSFKLEIKTKINLTVTNLSFLATLHNAFVFAGSNSSVSLTIQN